MQQVWAPTFFGADGSLLPHSGPHTAPINNAISPKQPKDERLEQALIYAVINDKIESVDYLLDQGTSINSMPSGFHFQGTALHWAAGGDSPAIVELLVKRGADIYAKAPKDMVIPLDIAEGRKRDEIVQLLEMLGTSR